MNFIQKSFLNTLKAASEDVVLMSRKNCHQMGLDSIVIGKGVDGRLTRAFFAHENHSMHLNSECSTLSLGIHNHQYNITLTKLDGLAFNLGFEDNNSDTPPKPNSTYKYRYTSQLTGAGGVSGAPSSNLHNLTQTSFEEITYNHLQYQDLHTVYVHKGEKAAWIVEEGIRMIDETLLYSPHKPTKISRAAYGYQSFTSKEEVVSMVEDFLAN